MVLTICNMAESNIKMGGSLNVSVGFVEIYGLCMWTVSRLACPRLVFSVFLVHVEVASSCP